MRAALKHQQVCVAAITLLALGGCAYAPLRTAAPRPLPLPQDVAAYYDYPARPRHAAIETLQERRGVREFLVRFPLSAQGFEPTEPVVEFEWFESTQPGRRPAIVFSPILGGDYPLERNICRYLAARGYHVAMVHRKTLKISPEHDIAHLETLLRQGVVRIRQVVDWMAAHERVDAERLGSFGVSMGGIAGAMAAAVEPRLQAHVIALAGGGIPEILRDSRDRMLTKPIARYLSRRQMDRDTLYRHLQERIKTDPVRLAPYVDRDRVFLFVALADRTIGRANALRLREALGKPRTVYLFLGHYTAYLSLPYLKYASWRFFEQAL